MKAIVLSVRGGRAALLLEDGTTTYRRMNCKPGQRVDIPDSNNKLQTIPRGIRVSAAAAAALALVVFSGNYYATGMPVSYVTMDVNPSIEYSLNRKNRVIKTDSLNEDASVIVDRLSISGKSVTQALLETEDALKEQGFFEDDHSMLLSVASDNPGRGKVITEEITAALKPQEKEGLTFSVLQVSGEERKSASDLAMSSGRYKEMIKKIDASNPDKTLVDAYRSKPVSELLQDVGMGTEPVLDPNAAEGSDSVTGSDTANSLDSVKESDAMGDSDSAKGSNSMGASDSTVSSDSIPSAPKKKKTQKYEPERRESDQPGQPAPSGQPGQPGQSAPSGQPGQPGQSAPSGQPGQPGQPAPSDHQESAPLAPAAEPGRNDSEGNMTPGTPADVPTSPEFESTPGQIQNEPGQNDPRGTQGNSGSGQNDNRGGLGNGESGQAGTPAHGDPSTHSHNSDHVGDDANSKDPGHGSDDGAGSKDPGHHSGGDSAPDGSGGGSAPDGSGGDPGGSGGDPGGPGF